jgi:hypothetical protein
MAEGEGGANAYTSPSVLDIKGINVAHGMKEKKLVVKF